MPTTTRLGHKAQRAARTAAEAVRAPNSVRREPVNRVADDGVADADGGVGRDVASPVAATGVGAPLGSPEYLAGFPSLGSHDKAAAVPTTGAAADGRAELGPADPAASGKSVNRPPKGAKVAKSVTKDVIGSDAVDSDSSTVVVSK